MVAIIKNLKKTLETYPSVTIEHVWQSLLAIMECALGMYGNNVTILWEG